MTSRLDEGRQAFERKAWAVARDALSEAREDGLSGDDLRRLALATYLVGDDSGFLRAMEEAHQAYLSSEEVPAAVRCAFWSGLHLAERGERARASGWFGRAGRLLEGIDEACAEEGYMLLPAGQGQMGSGRYDDCVATARRAEAIAERFGDVDLLTLALHLRGRALLRQGRVAEGLALLDDAMVSVVSDDLSPNVTGLVYCSVISACREVWALGRAQEWTRALTDWCERQPDMVAYTGECRVYRAEILQRRGAWSEALEEARGAIEDVDEERARATAGAAYYQQAEVHRLMGRMAAAEEAYREASRLGREPQPGLALLRLAQGEADAAEAALRRSLAEIEEPFRRARLLPARIEVALAIEDVEGAKTACDELEEIADQWGAPVLRTLADQYRGAILLASGDPSSALPFLRRAWEAWRALEAPYRSARVRALLGRACRELGDEDGAQLELQAAREELERLGAAPELSWLDAGSGGTAEATAHGLTRREREVLAQLATGSTNRAIAEALFISEKTVARHLANIYSKLGLSTRSAATAYAYEHDLVEPPT